MDMLMGQLSTMAMMKDSTRMMDALWTILFMMLVRQAVSWVPHVAAWGKTLVEKYLGSTYHAVVPIQEEDTKTASIYYTRSYSRESGDTEREEYRIADSLLNLAAKCDTAKYLRSNGRYYLAHEDEVQLDEGVFFRQISATLGEEQQLQTIVMEVFSRSLSLTRLRRAIQKIYEDYQSEMQNELGDKLYYFEDLPVTIPKDMTGRVRYEAAPKMLTYRMTPFYTSKTLTNIYGDAMRLVRKRVRFFMENRDWYDRNGIPYTLGLLLYGAPGCGKTSLIKAIANECNRHVFSVKLGEYTTRSQMTNLFFSEDIRVNQAGQDRTIGIPMKKRLLVFEEIDTMADVVRRREGINEDGEMVDGDDGDKMGRDREYASVMTSADGFPAMMSGVMGGGSHGGMTNLRDALPLTQDDPVANAPVGAQSQSEKLDIGTLLNLMDGVLETPGRILVMTTNRASMLDPALIRPGRIDIIVHFQKCKKHEVIEMYEGITGESIPEDIVEKIADSKFTPAKVTQKLFEHHDDPVRGIRELVDG